MIKFKQIKKLTFVFIALNLRGNLDTLYFL